MRLVSAAAAAFGFGAVMGGGALAQGIPAEAFARVEQIRSVSMSAEGDLLTAVIADPNNPYETALAVWDIKSIDPSKPLTATRITPSGDRTSFRSASALKSGAILASGNQIWTGSLGGCGEGKSTGATKTWLRRAFLTDASMKDFKEPLESARITGVSSDMKKCMELVGTSSLRSLLPFEKDSVLVSRLNSLSLETEYFKVNLKTGRADFMYRDVGDYNTAVINPRDGQVMVRTRTVALGGNEYDFEVYIKNPGSGDFELQEPLLTRARDRYNVDVLGYDEPSGKFFVSTDQFSDKAAIYLYDAVQKKYDPDPLFAHRDFDATGVVRDGGPQRFGQILGFRYAGGGVTTFWTDPEFKSIHDGLKAAFPGQGVGLIDWTEDRSRIVFQTESAQRSPAYYLLLDKSKVVMIGASRPWIDPSSVGEQSLVYYAARDGKQIPAILTLPPNWKKGDKPPPAIVHPHGGPWARDFEGWDESGWVPYLTSRGYAVLQPQYRGSTGWGLDLWRSGDSEWGQKMQDDKDDGARWMVAEGYADPEKIAIFGYSYGGFAAFAATVRENGPFACAIAGAGVSNLAKLGNNWSDNRVQRAVQGRTVNGMDPLQNAAKANIPIFIYHGERDVRVPLYHAESFYNAVKGKVKTRYEVYKDMGHQIDLWTRDNYRQQLDSIDEFLKSDCGF